MAEEIRVSSDEMDEQRQQQLAYQYLCHLEETKEWLSACVNEELPGATELEESLRNGVYLARLANFFAPEEVPLKKIYDIDQSVYREKGLHFRHTDNINHWLNAMKAVGLPEYFFPDPFDLYDKKNLPKVIYCLHALSLYLFRLGKAPKIEDLLGKVTFTNEEIDQMRKALSRYGIQMPSFSKIGGILAKEMSANEAALHAAIIAINNAIDNSKEEDLLEALKNPCAELENIHPENTEKYIHVLEEAREIKQENAYNRLNDSSYEADVYDELLNQAEIQGYIYETNVNVLLNQIDAAMNENDTEVFWKTITNTDLGIQDLVDENKYAYMEVLLKVKEDAVINNNPFLISKSDVQMSVYLTNKKVEEEKIQDEAIRYINKCLDYSDAQATLEALKNPKAKLPTVYALAADLYHKEFSSVRREAGKDLVHKEFVGGIKVLNAISEINFALKKKGIFNISEALRNPDAHIISISEDLYSRYVSVLLQALSNKQKEETQCMFMTHAEIQECVDLVNTIADEEHNHSKAIDLINIAVASGSKDKTHNALLNPAAKVLCVDSHHIPLYLDLLASRQSMKGGQHLTLEEIQEDIGVANKLAEDANQICLCLANINTSLQRNDLDEILTTLEILKVPVIEECKEIYISKLLEFIPNVSSLDTSKDGLWVGQRVNAGLCLNLNLQTYETEWTPDMPGNFGGLLTYETIQSIILDVNREHEKLSVLRKTEPLIVRFQAFARGYLARKQLNQRMDHFKNNSDQIIKIQAWWRSHLQHKQYIEQMEYIQNNLHHIIKLQAVIRGWLVRRQYKNMLEFYGDREWAAIKIQNVWRKVKARRDCKLLLHSTSPPLPVIRKFLHMLDISEHDFAQELELQKAKSKVVATIRHNQKLEKEVDEMDIKIGLLIRNCITLEDVMSHGRKGQNKRQSMVAPDYSWLGTDKGLNALRRDNREKLEAYQHLFYLLQTNPSYLARLIFAMPISKSNRFVESVIYSLYNYGSTPREEYLLLRLFETALVEEINSKVVQVSDILTGNPLVIRMVVGFNRTGRGQSCLKNLLEPLVVSVLNDNTLNIDLAPEDIYKQWVNDIEMSTGKPSGMKYDTTPDEAMQFDEVRKRLNESIFQLERKATVFCQTIVNSKEMIPYGIRYIGKVLKKSLEKKFPSLPEDETLKIVGSLFYYRFINPAIVAPDTFEIVQVSPEKPLSNGQRKHLGYIAKILQFAASGKAYDDHPYLKRLTVVITQCKGMFWKFFREACMVKEPDAYFNIDSYSELTMITQPMITITVQELQDTHQLLLEYRDDIAPDVNDALHNMLDDLGTVPTVKDLLGEEVDPAMHPRIAKTEICLTLSSKFRLVDDRSSDLDQIYAQTKQMLVDLMRHAPNCLTIREMLTAQIEESSQRSFLDSQEKEVVHAQNKSVKKFDSYESFRKAVQANLDILEENNIVSRNNDYQELLNSVAKDILQQKQYRDHRGQGIVRMYKIQQDLDLKTVYYEEKLEYYHRYIKACLDNLTGGKKARHSTSRKDPFKELRMKSCLKYSGARLHEKGILLEITDLDTVQLKNVTFEIMPSEKTGIFLIKAKFMGVSMDTVEIDIQELLQKQYEGIAMINIFGKARININLLLYLLNKKFYGK